MTQPTIDPEQLDQLILQRLPTLMRKNSQIQGLVLDLARQNFAERQETEDRFYQLLGELRRDREEQARKWEQYTTEQNRKWEDQNGRWEEQNRKWEEQNRKWEDNRREFDKLLEELRRDREEQTRKWEQYTAEQNHKWEQYIAEQNHKWEEQNRKWEEAKQEFNQMHEAIMAMAKKHDRSIAALGARWGLKSERSFRNALVGILETSFEVQVLNIIDYDDEGLVFGRPEQIELDIII